MHTMNSLLGGSYLLRALGLRVDNVFRGLEDFHDQLDQLHDLQDTFGRYAGLMGDGTLANLLQSGGIPGAMFMPAPSLWRGSSSHYAPSIGLDFGAAPGASPFGFEALMRRQQGAMFERYLEQNPFA